MQGKNNKVCKSFTCNNIVEDTIKAWGKEIHPVYCKKCRDFRRNYKAMQDKMDREFTYNQINCGHDLENKNPGGYCVICGSGRDFS